MEHRDFGPLDRKFWSEMLRYSWIVLACSIIGVVISVSWRKELPEVGAMEVAIYTNMPQEIFGYFVGNSQGIKITPTHQGRNIYRLVLESQGNVEEKFVAWAKSVSESAKDLLGSNLRYLRLQSDELDTQIKKSCVNNLKMSFEHAAICSAMRREVIELERRIIADDMSIKIVSFKPFNLAPTSFPLRDAFFGFFVGFFFSLIFLGFGLQIKQARIER